MGNAYTLSVTQVAKMLGKSEHTVRSLARSKELPAVKIGRDWYFLESALKERLTPESREVTSA